MDTDLVTSVIAARQSATLELAQLKLIKKQHEMDKTLIDMIDAVARSAPPPGQGTLIDKTA